MLVVHALRCTKALWQRHLALLMQSPINMHALALHMHMHMYTLALTLPA